MRGKKARGRGQFRTVCTVWWFLLADTAHRLSVRQRILRVSSLVELAITAEAEERRREIFEGLTQWEGKMLGILLVSSLSCRLSLSPFSPTCVGQLDTRGPLRSRRARARPCAVGTWVGDEEKWGMLLACKK